MDMIGSDAPGPVPVVLPLTTGTASLSNRRRYRAWSPEELLTLVKWSAGQLGPVGAAPLALARRHYQLLDRTGEFELWLIHWPQDGGLVLHDHGGSSGAFSILAGVLEETSTTTAAQHLRRRLVVPGAGHAFGPRYVHSVVNPAVAPATSVHAYSPPLASMTFYQRTTSGLVVSYVEKEWEGAP
jgi:Cysteine dioxygenase type I